jgi:hypothetical protein
MELDYKKRYSDLKKLHVETCEKLKAAEKFIDSLKVKPKKEIPKESISAEQYKDLLNILEDYDFIAMSILKFYDIVTLADLPKSEYHPALAQIRTIKKNAEDYENKKR